MDKPTTFLEMVQILINQAKSGSWKLTPFSKERKAQEPGDFYSDISKIKKYTGWEPKIPLSVGIDYSLDYYRKYKEHYWE